MLARVVWVALGVFTLSIFIFSLPAYFAQLQTVCVDVGCVYTYGQLTPGTAQALQNLGFSIGGYAASILALAIASALVSFGVASVLFWRRSDDWMAMLVSLLLVTFGVCVLAGTAFGGVGGNHIRISYANSRENLTEALARIKAFVAPLVPAA